MYLSHTVLCALARTASRMTVPTRTPTESPADQPLFASTSTMPPAATAARATSHTTAATVVPQAMPCLVAPVPDSLPAPNQLLPASLAVTILHRPLPPFWPTQCPLSF